MRTCMHGPSSIGRRAHRRGAVLLIVVGLAAMLLAIAGAVLALTRSEAMDGSLLVQDAQARIMLSAALNYIQESSRLGWGTETFGWTDVRNGTPGPRGPRDPRSGVMPIPTGWSGYERDSDSETDPSSGLRGEYKPLRSTSPHDPAPEGLLSGTPSWPMPGSTCRGDMFAMSRPPCAVRNTRHYNPVGSVTKYVEEWERTYDGRNLASTAKTTLGRALNPAESDLVDTQNRYQRLHVDVLSLTRINGRFDTRLLDEYQNEFWNLIIPPGRTPPGSYGMMNPQPEADSLADFLDGDRSARPESAGRSWFRVYREQAADHDGDGDPWYDVVPIAGHGVFVITCGAGGTRGFRDWGEVKERGATRLFGDDQTFFNDLRARERILWFRAEWTSSTGGGFDARTFYDAGTSYRSVIGRDGHDGLSGHLTQGLVNDSSLTASPSFYYTTNTSISYFGAFRWIQRLDRQPPRW